MHFKWWDDGTLEQNVKAPGRAPPCRTRAKCEGAREGARIVDETLPESVSGRYLNGVFSSFSGGLLHTFY